MSKYQIHFQNTMSLLDFMEKYGTEVKCHDALASWRWPEGFICPECGSTKHCRLNRRKIYQCNSCHHQVSITALTIFHSTKLPLTKWFLAMFLIARGKNGIAALELKRQIGVSYKTAWAMKQKVMQVMIERENEKQLSGRIEADDAYLGGKHKGGKRGRGSENNQPIIAAVATDEEGNPLRVKFSVVSGFRKRDIRKWAVKHLQKGSSVETDGLKCFDGIRQAGILHIPNVVGQGNLSTEMEGFHWVNTALGNLKSSIKGTYKWNSKKYSHRYLAEFQYRFNRRYNLNTIFPKLAWASLRTPPISENLLRKAVNCN